MSDGQSKLPGIVALSEFPGATALPPSAHPSQSQHLQIAMPGAIPGVQLNAEHVAYALESAREIHLRQLSAAERQDGLVSQDRADARKHVREQAKTTLVFALIFTIPLLVLIGMLLWAGQAVMVVPIITALVGFIGGNGTGYVLGRVSERHHESSERQR